MLEVNANANHPQSREAFVGDRSEIAMTSRTYTASLSKSQGRTGWSVIFRHPVRKDEATGKAGVRVRQGLGTRDESEAQRLLAQLNELLADSSYHDATARADAERRFDKRVVEIFFYKMVPEETDFRAIRNSLIPLPDYKSDGYIRALLLGTTGAGKTTLGRQLIGTDPETERFPSTSTAKTTVHDTEIILAEGAYRAVATFVSMDETREYLTECLSAAVLAAWRKASDGEIIRRLLNHVNQRFRFSYVLGNGPTSAVTDFDEADEDEDDGPDAIADDAFKPVDLKETNELLSRAVTLLKEIARRHGDQLRRELGATNEADERVIDELFEEEFDNVIRDDEQFHGIADDLLDEIEKRFGLLDPALVRRTKQGWPLSWSWETNDRTALIKAVSRFSSNYARYFGQLLTPLVNGVRVSGPFAPTWMKGSAPKLALLDGEGLGHTPKTTGSVSTTVSRRIEEVDAVLLVDNAMQPMQAATVAAMRELVSSGNATKLILVFTHFDEVKGDNLPTPSAKVQHVMASAENVLASIGEDLGPYAERALRKRLESARVFLEGIDKPLVTTTKAGARTIGQIEKLLTLLDEVIEKPQPVKAKPHYDRMNLVLAVKAAAESFHNAWFPRLGLEYKSGVGKEHWTRVKALSRRLATGMADHYDTLQPVADLRKELQDRIYVFVQNPLKWEKEPDEDQKQVVFDTLAENIARRMLALATQRVWKEKGGEWQSAFGKQGRGSTFVRADIIGNQIFEPAAPVPDVTPSIDRNRFLRDVAKDVEEASEQCGAKLV
jgi:hypothetical protein